jgi:hypothetical protein
VIFQHGRNVYFSTYPPPTLIHTSHRFTSASKTRLLCQPLPHFLFKLFVISETFSTNVEPLYMTDISHRKQETFLCLCTESFCPQEAHNRTCSLVVYPSSTFAILTTKPASKLVHARLLPRLCCYLVIHIGNLLRPLQLFYFHL